MPNAKAKAKAKAKPAEKMEKPENVLRCKKTNRQTAFKITIGGDCLCFCYKAGTCIKKGNRFDGDFFVRNQDVRVELRQY